MGPCRGGHLVALGRTLRKFVIPKRTDGHAPTQNSETCGGGRRSRGTKRQMQGTIDSTEGTGCCGQPLQVTACDREAWGRLEATIVGRVRRKTEPPRSVNRPDS